MIIASKGLPDNYKSIDYIYARGYIDTGIYPDADIRVEIAFLFKQIDSTQYLLGAGMTSWNDVFYIMINNKKQILLNIFDKPTIEYILKVNERYIIKSYKNELKLIDREGNIFSGLASHYAKQRNPNAIAIFNNRNKDGSVPNYFWSVCGVAYNKIYCGEKLIQHLVACERKSDGVVGMYDLVGRKFYTRSK